MGVVRVYAAGEIGASSLIQTTLALKTLKICTATILEPSSSTALRTQGSWSNIFFELNKQELIDLVQINERFRRT